jgi:hypothetical protein
MHILGLQGMMPSHLHLPRRPGLQLLEPGRDGRCVHDRRGLFLFFFWIIAELLAHRSKVEAVPER